LRPEVRKWKEKKKKRKACSHAFCEECDCVVCVSFGKEMEARAEV
jgi:hypothetical protein